MAERRCFTKKITESDAFLEMPMSSQCLYFHLCMNTCDDDGFVNKPRMIAKMVGASEDDLKILIAKSFVIVFESGVIVIKHWRMHNTLRNDRYHPTDYTEEYAQLVQKDNGSYTLATKWQPNGNQLATELNLTKHNLTEHNLKNRNFVPPTYEEVSEYCNERNNFVDAHHFVDFYTAKGWMVGTNKMKDWKACVRTWERKCEKPKEAEDYRPNYDRTNEEVDTSNLDRFMKERENNG